MLLQSVLCQAHFSRQRIREQCRQCHMIRIDALVELYGSWVTKLADCKSDGCITSLPVFRRCNFLRWCGKLLMLLFPFTIFRIATALIFNTAVIPDIEVFGRNAFLQSR